MGTGENKLDVMGNQDLSSSLSRLLFTKHMDNERRIPLCDWPEGAHKEVCQIRIVQCDCPVMPCSQMQFQLLHPIDIPQHSEGHLKGHI